MFVSGEALEEMRSSSLVCSVPSWPLREALNVISMRIDHLGCDR
jgi:hypothetical protein